MNRRGLCLLSGVLAILLHVDALPGQTPDLSRIGIVADSLARAQIEAGLAPGLSIAIAKDGNIAFTRGYGIADVEMGVPAGAESVYQMGSISKQFAAAVVMRLVEQGKISLEDPITRYLPDYPAQGQRVTVRHLLNHTSGIQGYQVLAEENQQQFRTDLTYQEMVDLFGRQPFVFNPGERWEYNNFGYYLLGEIIGRVTGVPYAEYVERELLQPLGLEHTTYCDARKVVPNRAEGYESEDGELVNARYVSMRVVGAAGSFCSTVGDLVRWTDLLHRGQIVSPASLQQMTTPTVLSSGDSTRYGYGLYLHRPGGHRRISHPGAANGFTSFLSHYPESGLTIALAMNSIVRVDSIAHLELALARTALARDGQRTSGDNSLYLGTYTLSDPSGRTTRDLRVFMENGQLKAELAGEGTTLLRPRGEHEFLHGERDDVRFVFVVENGRAESVTLHSGSRMYPGRRNP